MPAATPRTVIYFVPQTAFRQASSFDSWPTARYLRCRLSQKGSRTNPWESWDEMRGSPPGAGSSHGTKHDAKTEEEPACHPGEAEGVASSQGPLPGSTAHRVGLSRLCGGTSGSDPLPSRIRKLFLVVRGRAYGQEFWHLLHRHAQSASMLHGSGRLCLAQPCLVL